jgi:hypothetical protein
MDELEDSLGAERVREIAAVLRRHGGAATRGRTAEQAAREWVEAGFEDAEEVGDWLRARCFDAAGARRVEDAGITPEQAAMRTTAGASGEEDTIGFKLTGGDLSLEEARRLVTSAFWNT